MSKEDLLSRTDLEEETIDEVIRILKAEFEDEPAEQNEAEDEEEKDEVEAPQDNPEAGEEPTEAQPDEQ